MNKETFILSLLHSPYITAKQRGRLMNLMVKDASLLLADNIRDIIREELNSNIPKRLEQSEDTTLSAETEEKVNTENLEKSEKSVSLVWNHDPHFVSTFLRNFSTEKSVLKDATHQWDMGDYDNASYTTFIKQLHSVLKGKEEFKVLYNYCMGLYFDIRAYILGQTSRNSQFGWGPDNIQIGLCYPDKYIKKWANENPHTQIWSMRLNEFPAEFIPCFEDRQLATLGDIRDEFKKVIEFRDKNFAKTIYKIFRCTDFHLDIDKDNTKRLKSIQGLYTYTPSVENALYSIFNNIKQHSSEGANTVKISITENTEEQKTELHILHIGSFSDMNIDNPRLKNGTMASLRLHKKVGLMSVCDFEVKSRFLDKDGELCNFRIGYLYPDVQQDEDGYPEVKFSPIPDEDVKGFEYILTFYN